MAKVRPLVMNFPDIKSLESMRDEYEFIGREVDIDSRELKLTVLTLPRKYKKKQVKEAKAKAKKETEFDYEEYGY